MAIAQHKHMHMVWSLNVGVRFIENSSLRSFSIPYFETSAVTGVDVERAVTTLLGLVMKRMEQSTYGGRGSEPNGSPDTSNEVAEAPVRRRCAC